jgi:hypothetical protein
MTLFSDGNLLFRVQHNSDRFDIEALTNESWVSDFIKIDSDYKIVSEKLKQDWRKRRAIELKNNFNL